MQTGLLSSLLQGRLAHAPQIFSKGEKWFSDHSRTDALRSTMLQSRLSDLMVRGVVAYFTLSTTSFLFSPLPLLPILPRLPTLAPFPSPPLVVGPLYPARESEGVEPQKKSNLVQFSLKIRHVIVTISMIFLRTNWPNSVHKYRPDLPERCSSVPAVMSNIFTEAPFGWKIFAGTALRRVPAPLRPCLWFSRFKLKKMQSCDLKTIVKSFKITVLKIN